jgi:hypothetical protein
MKLDINDLIFAAEKKDWTNLTILCRQWLNLRRHYIPHLFLIHALICLGRFEEADIQFEALLAYKFNLADRIDNFPTVKKRYSRRLSNDNVISTMRDGIGFESEIQHLDVHRWSVPSQIDSKEGYRIQAEKIVFEYLGGQSKYDETSSSIVTFGSCFAANLARFMFAKGMSADNILIEESLNSTSANRVIVELLCGENLNQTHREIAEKLGPDRIQKIREKIADAKIFVLTVGVAPTFYFKESNKLVVAENYKDLLRSGKIYMRTTSCSENVSDISSVMKLVARMAPQAKRVVTVSPVPLVATSELTSATVADCTSKSILRAAVHETVCLDSSIIYFPSFEIVKWLACHSTLGVYGADDGNSRHVSNWVVSMIVDIFRSTFIK